MNPIRFFRSVIETIKDPERDFTDRIFLILTFVSEISVMIALIFDIIMKENPYEIAVIISIFVISPVLTLF